jgi:Family of unknown function (DUF5995)
MSYRAAMSDLTASLALRPANSIGDARAIMTKIDETLPRADGVACFNKLYLAVTSGVLSANDSGTFENPAFLAALDVAFANLYFDALAALDEGRSADVPRAWRPLFAARARTDIAPIQFAFAGMNAHINRDLPVGIVETFLRLGLVIARPSPEYADFERVNDILETTETQVKQLYATGFAGKVLEEFDGVDDVIAMWSVRTARAAAWTNAEALWNLRPIETVESAYLDALDGMVGFASRGLLVATG